MGACCGTDRWATPCPTAHSSGLRRRGPRICISNSLPGEADAASAGTPLEDHSAARWEHAFPVHTMSLWDGERAPRRRSMETRDDGTFPPEQESRDQERHGVRGGKRLRSRRREHRPGPPPHAQPSTVLVPLTHPKQNPMQQIFTKDWLSARNRAKGPLGRVHIPDCKDPLTSRGTDRPLHILS